MKFSSQTVLLILGVTLAHLIAISALSPTTQSSGIASGVLSQEGSFVGPVDETAQGAEAAPKGTHPIPQVEAEEPIDLPAQLRVVPGAPAPSENEPVAQIRPLPEGGADPQALAPLPKS